MDLDRVRQRIAQLLKVAENNAATDGEVENALRAARNLMMAYHVEESEVVQPTNEDGQMARVVVPTWYSRVTYWEKSLAVFVQQLLGGVGMYSDSDAPEAMVRAGNQFKQFGAIVYYGLEQEAALAADTHDELAQVVHRLATTRYGGSFRGDGAVYALGFVTGLMRQLSELDAENNAASHQELVVRSRAIVTAKLENARRWLAEEMGIQLKQSRPSFSSTGSRQAHQAGVRDGRNHDLSGLHANRANSSNKRLTFDR